MTKDFQSSFGGIARGLLSLEINTIVKPSMTAVHMPAPPDALYEIVAEYRAWLHDRRPLEPVPVDLTVDDIGRVRAVAALVVADGSTESEVLMATRIATNCERLLKIFPHLASENISPDRLLQLRKMWEIGTEEIVVQTVVWLDGDVVQRVKPDYLARGDILAVHQLGVRASLKVWKSLTKLIAALFENVWKGLMK